MKIKGLVEEDFVNYRKPSMYIIFPTCSFKCDKENGNQICQNGSLVKEKDLEISFKDIVDRYKINPITKAIVMGGLEPFDSFDDLIGLIDEFRKVTNDDIVIYTGYEEDEIFDKIEKIINYGNIIVKFGRYIPNRPSYFNELLGVILVGRNQYVVSYSGRS